MRVIDADALKKEVENIMSETMDMSFQIYAQGFCTTIDKAPTIDAVEVVRCKDCKWYESGGLPCPLDLCESLGDDGFCSHGERSE